ncbi:MAG TPA: hypothetical protein VG326_00830 [Tepidisphaeraceae bacterium]|jgi:hypothetical protein|nr:hypothetical protein [Tepidisphaeraceae bacterium]
MGTRFISARAAKIALIAIAASAAASFCNADQVTNGNRLPLQTVTAGQGGYIQIPDLRPAPASYALTGEESQYRQTLHAWQQQAGPMYSVGNARIVIPIGR